MREPDERYILCMVIVWVAAFGSIVGAGSAYNIYTRGSQYLYAWSCMPLWLLPPLSAEPLLGPLEK